MIKTTASIVFLSFNIPPKSEPSLRKLGGIRNISRSSIFLLIFHHPYFELFRNKKGYTLCVAISTILSYCFNNLVFYTGSNNLYKEFALCFHSLISFYLTGLILSRRKYISHPYLSLLPAYSFSSDWNLRFKRHQTVLKQLIIDHIYRFRRSACGI